MFLSAYSHVLNAKTKEFDSTEQSDLSRFSSVTAADIIKEIFTSEISEGLLTSVEDLTVDMKYAFFSFYFNTN